LRPIATDVGSGLAALKSMSPHLSHHRIRACILETAHRSPPYDREWIYGQGRLDSTWTRRRVGVDRLRGLSLR